MKSAREKMDMIAAYVDVGTYRGAAAICGTNHHTPSSGRFCVA